ncbi:sensor histidine kinase [Rhizobium sp. TH2]|uniref:sensor histidine kinase n=1 Tax=Rhizobium sp. TH2 TaxID=2775403 RepID=UPI0021577529|nr:sensor histidine kinase [Rhizobium sp. TH2]
MCKIYYKIRLRLSAIACMAIACFALMDGSEAASQNRVPRVLILYPYDERIPATSIAGQSVRTHLMDATDGKIDLFTEFLDLARFPQSAHIDRMSRYLSEKYVDHRPDVVITLGEEATRFMNTHGRRIAPDARIVYGGFDRETAAELDLPTSAVGAVSEFDVEKTVALAMRLQPDAKRLVVMVGSSSFDQRWLRTAKVGLADIEKTLETTYVTGFSIDEFAEQASQLPDDTVLVVLTIMRDRNGRNLAPRTALERITAVANVPVYGPYSTYIGSGAVGANSVTFESVGEAIAKLSLEIIAGRDVADIDVQPRYLVDARQMQRWGFAESNLPPNTIVSFSKPSVFDEFFPQVMTVLAFILAQSVVIIALVFERRRRGRAEREARNRLHELIHLNQSATAGALSASIAHELNQPLGAILINAETAEQLLRNETPDLSLIRQILIDIQDADRRAGDMIGRMKGLLKKRSEIDWQEFDLNNVVKSAAQILQADIARKKVRLEIAHHDRALLVRADQVHIQQVVLNLATNAIDAMQEFPVADKRLKFETSLDAVSGKVEFAISDTGGGIATENLTSVFDAFYTTKAKGTGLGLSIARAIIEIYGGRIWADNHPQGGAIFRFALPHAGGG